MITGALIAQIRLFGSLLRFGWKGCGQLKILKPGILRDADIETISSFHRQENLMWQFLLITDGLSVSIIKHSLII
jgi:hypothetical protein|tara:strand:+ start:224 stop:448 length:225 start_codon:yes stop_codon:yes gene_type:complete